MVPKYKSNFIECLTKITSISKLNVILLTNKYIYLFFIKKMENASETESISKQAYTLIQGTLSHTQNLYLILPFLKKKW